MGVYNLFKLSFLVNLLSSSSNLGWLPVTEKGHVGIFPPTCTSIECPTYQVIDAGNGFEIRRYNSSMWMSTSPIDDISFVEATRTGFLQLFKYIEGDNDYKEQIEMTAPVLTQVKPSDGPFCASSFVVSFYVPKEKQANPPTAEGLHLQTWGTTYVAVRQFSGFVSDADVGQQAAALYTSIAGTKWSDAIDKSHQGGGETTTLYNVAQYNSPFEFANRVNEIWMTFDIMN